MPIIINLVSEPKRTIVSYYFKLLRVFFFSNAVSVIHLSSEIFSLYNRIECWDLLQAFSLTLTTSIIFALYIHRSFPGGSDGEESFSNVGYLGSVPGLGRSPREGTDIKWVPGRWSDQLRSHSLWASEQNSCPGSWPLTQGWPWPNSV